MKLSIDVLKLPELKLGNFLDDRIVLVPADFSVEEYDKDNFSSLAFAVVPELKYPVILNLKELRKP